MESQPETDLPSWCWSCRFMVAVLCCLSFMNMHALQLALLTTPFCNGNMTSPSSSNLSTECHVSIQPNDDVYGDDMNELAWNEEASQQLVLSSFVWGNLVSILPAGLLAGWVGGRKMIGYSHMLMSAAALLTPLAIRFMHSYTVTGLKFIAGLMAGATYPSAMALWQKWAPPGERTRLLAITFTGIPLGIVLTSSAREVMCFYTWLGGLSGVLYCIGILGIVWFILWMNLVSSQPDKNHRITDAECSMIKKCLGEGDEPCHTGGFSWSALLCCQSFWAMAFAQLATEWGLYLLVSVVPVYLRIVLHIDINSTFSGYFSTAPFCALMFITLVFASIVDCVSRSWPNCTMAVRRFFALLGSFGVTACFVFLCFVDCLHLIVIMTLLTVATGCHGFLYASVMTMPLELSRRHAAVVSAAALTVMRPLIFGGSLIVSHIAGRDVAGEWKIMFYVSAAIIFSCGTGFAVFGGASILPLKESTTRTTVGEQSVEMVSLSAASEHRASGGAECGPKTTDAVAYRNAASNSVVDGFVGHPTARYIYAVGPTPNHVGSYTLPRAAEIAGNWHSVGRSVEDVTSVDSRAPRPTNSQMVSLV